MTKKIESMENEAVMSDAELAALEATGSIFDFEDDLDAAGIESDDDMIAAEAELDDELGDLDEEEIEAHGAEVELDDDAAEMLDAAVEISELAAADVTEEAKTERKAAVAKTKTKAEPKDKSLVTVEFNGESFELPPHLSRILKSESSKAGLASLAARGVEADDLEATVNGSVEELINLPKKIQEKAANLAEVIGSGKKLSPYTKIALDEINSQGSITRAHLVTVYQAAGYSAGTAGAQASQMVKLLPWSGLVVAGGEKSLIKDDANPLWANVA